tara:strand:+ start:55 stop:498 length:444 start_codon:yes stop_codon:yes gene_type:complete
MNISYDNELSDKIYNRNIPGQNMKPNFSFRPQSTKYSHFQVIDKDVKSSVPLMTYDKVSYNPGDRGPTNEYFQKIDLESELKNQIYALQKDSQHYYVPNVNSDLYVNTMNYEKKYTQYIPQQQRKMNQPQSTTFNHSTRYHIKEKKM